MKTKFTLFAVATLLSLSAAAVDPKTLALADGSTATVLSQNGRSTPYIKEAMAGSDGKVQLIQGEVFDGEQLVKKADGQCLLVRQRLVRLNEVTSGGVKIQIPEIATDYATASCNS